ncbi:MAG: DUF488 domain-containing protein [Myxococcales bacterium]|nr:DUF488 domain-containing protein [Myxococcales bacterium]
MRESPLRLFERQKTLLALLHALGGRSGKTDFQKLLFLYCQRVSAGAPYDFVPHHFGAYSFSAKRDRLKLQELGLLVPVDRWELTNTGQRIASQLPIATEVSRIAQQLPTSRGDELVALTCRRFPWYATRSEIATRVLSGDKDALAKIDAAKPTDRAGKLLTLGYEGHSLESYLDTLLRTGTTILCDVRRNPLSRKYGFSKSTLRESCKAVGIRYEHLPELGIASARRRTLETQSDYDALFADYERDDLPHQGEAISRIVTWIGTNERVTLTCYEHLPHQCHRHCVAEVVEKQLAKTGTTSHL